MAVAILPSMRDFFTGRSRALPLIVGALVIVSDGAAAMQRGRTTSAKPAPATAAKKEPAQVKCAELLGTGTKTSSTYCFVLAGRDPAEGVIVTVPPHAGEATLTFDLHNRHLYSEEERRG